MGALEDAKAAEAAASKVVADLEQGGGTSTGTFTLTETTDGFSLSLTKDVPAAPAEAPLPPQNE